MTTKKRPVLVQTRTGKTVRLLRPNEKRNKFKAELKSGVALTNFGKTKVNKYGEAVKLTKAQKAYRSGYITANVDGAKVYYSKRQVALAPIPSSYMGSTYSETTRARRGRPPKGGKDITQYTDNSY